MEELKIKDDSGDKEFFTIIPNYIANHSTANDQALYLQMKKHAGEEGSCFATEKTLMSKLGIGKKAFDKSLNYLLTKRWITFIGLTDGKTRPIRTYKINNIWHLNSSYYKEISSKRTLSFIKDKSQKERDKSQKQHKISAESNIEEEPVKEEPLINTCNDDVVAGEVKEIIELRATPIRAQRENRPGKEIEYLISLFKDINPSYERFFSNKSQRAALERLTAKHGQEKIENTIKILPQIINKPYAPRITTPLQLESKLGELGVFYNQEKTKEKSRGIKVSGL